jgi:hypothetical protein
MDKEILFDDSDGNVGLLIYMDVDGLHVQVQGEEGTGTMLDYFISSIELRDLVD